MPRIGFLKIDRSILDWRWYSDTNTFRVFMHLMLKANYTDTQYKTHTIKRGQCITGRKKLSEELKLSEQQIRTALVHLKSTNDITIETHSKHSIITINNYEDYQKSTNKLTSNQPASNQQATSNQPHNKNNKKNKNSRNNYYRSRNASYSIDDFENKSLFKD